MKTATIDNIEPLSNPHDKGKHSSSPPSQGGTQGGFDTLPGENKPSSEFGSSTTSTTATILDDTYWFHYDIHGNVLKVTDDTQTTKITYTYNTLGQLTTETNPDGIPNFFKYRGVTQTLHDPLLDLYFGGGFYRPDLGTSLATVGVASNPTSGATISAKAHAFKAAGQTVIQSSLANVSSKVVMNCSVNSGLTAVDGRKPTGSASDTSIDYFAHNKVTIPKKEEIDTKGQCSTPGRRFDDEGPKDEDNIYDPPATSDPDPGDLEGIVEDDVLWWGKQAAFIANAEKKEAKRQEDAVWNDDNPDDDHEQYKWCVRDEEGNIVACQTKVGGIFIFSVGGEDNLRDMGSGSLDMSTSNWKNIMEGIDSGKSKVGMWDQYGFVTDGCVGMQMDDGQWLGFFYEGTGSGENQGTGANKGNLNYKGRTGVRYGTRHNFGFVEDNGLIEETFTGDMMVSTWAGWYGDWLNYYYSFDFDGAMCLQTSFSEAPWLWDYDKRTWILEFLYKMP